jgi:hypothetical protein
MHTDFAELKLDLDDQLDFTGNGDSVSYRNTVRRMITCFNPCIEWNCCRSDLLGAPAK